VSVALPSSLGVGVCVVQLWVVIGVDDGGLG